jgi:hypothetical protein
MDAEDHADLDFRLPKVHDGGFYSRFTASSSGFSRNSISCFQVDIKRFSDPQIIFSSVTGMNRDPGNSISPIPIYFLSAGGIPAGSA